MKKLPNEDKQRFLRLKGEIAEEILSLEALDKELTKLKSILRRKNVSSYNLRAAGSILHDFYNGVENIFRRIAQELNGGLPAGEDWHRQLLTDMGIEIEGVRPAVISKTLRKSLQEYLGFRHVFRNIYGFSLEKKGIVNLSDHLSQVLARLKEELSKFCRYLDMLSQAI